MDNDNIISNINNQLCECDSQALSAAMLTLCKLLEDWPENILIYEIAKRM